MNPFEPGQNSEHQNWWPDTASKPKETNPAQEPDIATTAQEPDIATTAQEPIEAFTAPETMEATTFPETDKTATAPDMKEIAAAPETEETAAVPEPKRIDPSSDSQGSDPAPDSEGAATPRSETYSSPEPQETANIAESAEPTNMPEPEEPVAAPDPSRPLPGESYADFMHRLDRERMKARESTDYGRQEYWAGLRDYGRGVSGDPNYGPIPEEFISNGMSKAAFIFGIASLVSILFNGSMFFGSLGILFALLSRKNKFSRQARIGLWMSIAGVTTFLLMLIISISILVSTGTWNKMMDIVKNMDPNQQVSVSEIQDQLMDEVLANYGAQRSGTNT